MLNKNEALKMVKEYQDNIKKKNLENAKNLCENEISQEIEKSAKKGNNFILFSVPTCVDVNIVIEILAENGYKIIKKTYTYLSIEW